MKKFLALFALVSVALACNLMGRKGSNTNSSSSSGTSSTAEGEPVEKANPTAAQQAAIANGQTVNWDQQGITLTMPQNWKKVEVRNEMFTYSGGGAHLSINISLVPTLEELGDTPLNAAHESAKTQQKIGKYDEVKWLELDGLRGVQFREAKQEMPDDIRRLQWQAYRKYGGTFQLVNYILSTDSGNFAQHQDELYGILYSTKVVH